MTTFLWILLGGLLRSAVALVGSVTLVLSESTLKKILRPVSPRLERLHAAGADSGRPIERRAARALGP